MPDDSEFCQYCGNKLETVIEETEKIESPVEEFVVSVDSIENNRNINICEKCGNAILEGQAFCPHCGKKIKINKEKKPKDVTKAKKIRKIIIIIVSIIVAILLAILAAYIAYWGIYEYQEKQDSYDLTTSWHWYDDNNNPFSYYSYNIYDVNGNELADTYFLYDNYYIRMITHGDVVYVSEKGIYEFNNNELITQTEDGQISQHKDYRGFLLDNSRFYNGNIPKKDLFDAELQRKLINGSEEKLTFKSDGTYILSNYQGVFNGTYTRDGYKVTGICDNINGSGTWIVYDGKLTNGFFEQGVGNTDRLRYEFFKYLNTTEYDRTHSIYRWYYKKFVTDYEEAHPITIN